LTQLVFSIFIGFLYDLFGRKFTVILSYIIIIIALVLIPYTAPSIVLLSLVRGMLGVGIQMQQGNPLTNDYITHDTRGKASIINSFGYILGETFSMAVLYNFTRHLDPQLAFVIVAATLVLFAIPTSIITVDAP
jgi:MFS family permease